MLDIRWLSPKSWTLALITLIAGTAVADAARADVVIIDGSLSIGIGQSYPDYSDYFYPGYRRSIVPQIVTEEIEDSTLINPVIIGAPIEDSTLINPVIVPPGYGRTIVRPGYGVLQPGNDNPACFSFQSIRRACQ